MGYDMAGGIEVIERGSKYDTWRRAIDIRYLKRNYTLYGVLIGDPFLNIDDVEAITPEPRGFPEDVSDGVRCDEQYPDENGEIIVNNPDHYAHTWMTLDEIKAFPWDTKLYYIEPNPNFKPKTDIPRTIKTLTTVREWCHEFMALVECMEAFEKEYGKGNVRLVVWFS